MLKMPSTIRNALIGIFALLLWSAGASPQSPDLPSGALAEWFARVERELVTIDYSKGFHTLKSVILEVDDIRSGQPHMVKGDCFRITERNPGSTSHYWFSPVPCNSASKVRPGYYRAEQSPGNPNVYVITQVRVLDPPRHEHEKRHTIWMQVEEWENGMPKEAYFSSYSEGEDDDGAGSHAGSAHAVY